MTQSPFGPGRLDADWLKGTSDNGWLLQTTDPFAPGHRDAFIGNGFIGQRLGIEGDGSNYPVKDQPTTPSGCLIHGLWSEIGLMAPPKWALLHYFDGTAGFSRNTGHWREYRQSLDIQNAILQTEVLWVNGDRSTRIITRAYIDRSTPGRCVISRTICPEFSSRVAFTDELDGTFIECGADWAFANSQNPNPYDQLWMELRMGRRQRWIAAVSRLAFEEGFISEGGPAAFRPELPIAVSMEVSERRIARTLTFNVEAGRTYTITKVVGLVTDSLAPSPRIAAATLAETGAFDPGSMEASHRKAWSQVWRNRIEVAHPRLQVLINAALYQLYSSLRESGTWSLGPTGLSANSWGGRAFWDADLWMFPALCLLNPKLGRSFVDYRGQTLPGARRNAQAAEYDGAGFAWESAEFGDESIPHLIYHHQHHVNSDVALAQWWYWKISGDDEWFRNTGARVIIESAKFWASRVTYVPDLDRFEIHHVCCADEMAEIQDNNAYTNYSAVKTIELAMAASSFLGESYPPEWSDIVARMWIPHDDANQNIFEYEGYAGQTIKQADTALLIYPYEMPLPDVVKRNIVDYYRTKYPKGHIMMAAAFDGIVDCELGRQLAWESVLKLLSHFREPFLIASESPLNETSSFLTGLGGFLQLILMGFAGIRIHENGVQVHPQLPKAVQHMTVHGMHYGGVRFDLQIDSTTARILNPSRPFPFEICNASGQPWDIPTGS